MHRADYLALDGACEPLCEEERLLGRFELV